MSEEKRIEQEIGWYKVLFTISVVTDISLLAWFAQNYETTKPLLLWLCSYAVILIIIGIFFMNKKVFKLLDKLEEL